MKTSLIGAIILLGLLYPWQIGLQEPVIVEPITIEELMEPIATVESEIVNEQMITSVQEEVIEGGAPVNRWGIELTDDEIDMLAKIMFLEAHLESEDGIGAAIEVVFNRMISDNFPDTLEGVLSQSEPCVQFTSWKNIDIAEPTEKEYNMIYAALNGEKEVLTTEYVYFGRGKQNNNDPIKIGEHWFCKE